mmetsp:Transcript_61366/g.170161  ORF Transcript_61366/g.170161 Transcript_61366/m.170161 type:complete len:286 (+) Transcript_61366:1240-2097(+)
MRARVSLASPSTRRPRQMSGSSIPRQRMTVMTIGARGHRRGLTRDGSRRRGRRMGPRRGRRCGRSRVTSTGASGGRGRPQRVRHFRQGPRTPSGRRTSTMRWQLRAVLGALAQRHLLCCRPGRRPSQRPCRPSPTPLPRPLVGRHGSPCASGRLRGWGAAAQRKSTFGWRTGCGFSSTSASTAGCGCSSTASAVDRPRVRPRRQALGPWPAMRWHRLRCCPSHPAAAHPATSCLMSLPFAWTALRFSRMACSFRRFCGAGVRRRRPSQAHGAAPSATACARTWRS